MKIKSKFAQFFWYAMGLIWLAYGDRALSVTLQTIKLLAPQCGAHFGIIVEGRKQQQSESKSSESRSHIPIEWTERWGNAASAC